MNAERSPIITGCGITGQFSGNATRLSPPRSQKERNSLANDPVEDINRLMIGIQFEKLRVVDRDHVVFVPIGDQCGLREIGGGRKPEGVPDQAVMHAPNPVIAKVKDLKVGRLRLADSFIPAPDESECRGQKYRSRCLWMLGRTQRSRRADSVSPGWTTWKTITKHRLSL